MDSCLLDVLHYRADVDVVSVAERVDVDLDGVLEEAVDEHATEHRHLPDFLVRVTDAHRTSSEHVRRADEDGVPDVVCNPNRVFARLRHPPRRRAQVVRAEQAGEALAVLGKVDCVVWRAEDRVAGRLDPRASFSGVPPPNWMTTPAGRSRSQTASTASASRGSK